MSKYAKIEDGIVTNVIVCEDSDISLLNGQYIKYTELTNNPKIGDEYVSDRNKFKSQQPYPSWTLDEESLTWISPVQIPEDAEISSYGIVFNYKWDEESLSWKKPAQ